MLKPSKINKLNNFICGWYINPKVCDNLISYFESNPYKQAGIMGTEKRLSPNVKKSTDLGIFPENKDKQIIDYKIELSYVIDEYKKVYPQCHEAHSQWQIIEGFNIQRYKPEEGFKMYHTERMCHQSVARHLVFMTYLNTVKNGGQTEFYFQKLKVKPEKGLTLIWPVDWTFTHRGVVSNKETKYIATGWYSYITNN